MYEYKAPCQTGYTSSLHDSTRISLARNKLLMMLHWRNKKIHAQQRGCPSQMGVRSFAQVVGSIHGVYYWSPRLVESISHGFISADNRV